MKNNHQKLIVILGPTAAGKTSLALKLAQEFDGEIISADSRQIYRGMDIGTDKIKNGGLKQTPPASRPKIDKLFYDQIKGINHYLIDIVNPDEEYTLAQFKKDAVTAIQDIQKRGKLPFLVGGTGLYIKAVVDNLQIPSVPPDEAIRSELEAMNNEKLMAELEKLDPVSAKKIDLNNKRRLIRAVEVCRITGQPFSEQTKKGEQLFDILQIGLKAPREKLYERIEQRVEEMFTEGLLEEVKGLAEKYSSDLPAMSGIGYKEVGQYLQNKISLEETKELIKRNSRRYAKRQLTWFKRDERIKWVEDYKRIKLIIEKLI